MEELGKKKNKKRQCDLEESESISSTKKMKRKKKSKEKNFEMQNNDCEEQDLCKSKPEELVLNSSHEEVTSCKPKKKKKSKEKNFEMQNNDCEEQDLYKSKPEELVLNSSHEEVTNCKPKKKKKKSRDVTTPDSHTQTQQKSFTYSASDHALQKAEKKKKNKMQSEGDEDNLQCENSQEEKIFDKSKKKKKKKKNKHVDDGCNLEPEDANVNSKEKKANFCIQEEVSESAEQVVDGLKGKKKEKKKCPELVVENCSKQDASVDGDDDKKEKKKKKKKKKTCESDSESKTSLKSDELEEAQIQTPKKLKKRKREKDESDIHENTTNGDRDISQNDEGKKKSKKRKSGNANVEDSSACDNLSTPKSSHLFKEAVFESAERKLQFSRLSGKRPVSNHIENGKHDNDTPTSNNQVNSVDSNSSASTPTCIKGQWDGALFEDEQRQSKFLRLLGGMKSAPNSSGKKSSLFSSSTQPQRKGLYGSLGNQPQKKGLYGSLGASFNKETESKGGMKALSFTEAANVEKRLEEDYNRAMNFKLCGSRGSGLGFVKDPAEGKKFHIDANASKSMKFDDDSS